MQSVLCLILMQDRLFEDLDEFIESLAIIFVGAQKYFSQSKIKVFFFSVSVVILIPPLSPLLCRQLLGSIGVEDPKLKTISSPVGPFIFFFSYLHIIVLF